MNRNINRNRNYYWNWLYNWNKAGFLLPLRLFLPILFTLSFSISFLDVHISLASAESAQVSLRCKTLFEIRFEEEFKNRKTYCAGYCDENIYTFLAKLQTEGINISQAQVLIVLYDSTLTDLANSYTKRSLKPQKARSPEAAPLGWTYHVILQVEGRIYDFDYGRQAMAPSLKDYFNSMWVGTMPFSFNPLERIKMRAIPAQEYLKKYEVQNPDSFREMRFDETHYPHVSVEEYLSKQLD